MTNTNLERQDSPSFASKFHFTQTNSQPLDPYQRWSSRASPKHAEGFQSPTATTGDDVLVGGPGSDIIYGLAGNHQIWGRKGDDLISGDDGNDTLNGETGDDRLDGGDGNDRLIISSGGDWLVGGPGDDTFVANSFSTRHATVADWAVGFDIIDLHELLAARHLDASSVYFDTTAKPGDTIVGVTGTAFSLTVTGADLGNFDTNDLQQSGVIYARSAGPTILDEVPSYNWYHGCSPTAAASLSAITTCTVIRSTSTHRAGTKSA